MRKITRKMQIKAYTVPNASPFVLISKVYMFRNP